MRMKRIWALFANEKKIVLKNSSDRTSDHPEVRSQTHIDTCIHQPHSTLKARINCVMRM